MDKANEYQKRTIEELQGLGWRLVCRLPKDNPRKELIGYTYKLESSNGSLVACVDLETIDHFVQ